MSNSNSQIKLVTMSNVKKKTAANKNTINKSANYAKKSSNPDAKKYYAQMANKDPVGYMKNSLEYIDKKYKKADGTYDKAFYKAPKDYHHNSNYTYKSTYKYEPTERGLVDRIFGVLGYNGIPQAIYNAIDDDESTTFLGGLKQGLKYMNPFEDDVSDRKIMSDVFKEAGWDGNSIADKIGRGVVGFLGDVVLDPLSYIPFLGAGTKLLKGAGLGVKGINSLADAGQAVSTASKAVKANRVAEQAADAITSTSRTKNLANLSYDTALNVMRKQYPSMSEKKLGAVTLKTLDRYAGKVQRVRGLDEGEGLTFGLGNLVPFAHKIKVGDKTLDYFTKEIISASTLRKLGNRTVAPYYNSLARSIRSTKTAGKFSNNNRLFRISQEFGDEEAFKRFALSEAEKGASKANRNMNALLTADELQRSLDDLGEEYDDIRFLQDHDEGLYEKVYGYRTLKNKAAEKATKASNLAAAEKEARLKSIQETQQSLDSVYNKTMKKRNEIFAKYEGSDLKNLDSAIKSKKEELEAFVNSAKKGTEEFKSHSTPAFKSQVAKVTDTSDETFIALAEAEKALENTREIKRKIGEYQIEDYEKKLHLTQKYFREAYTMMGKGISKMDAGESQRFFTLFSDLEDLSPTGKINWGELLNEYDNNALRMRVRNKLSINANASEPVSWKNAFLSLDETTQRAVINGYKDKLIDNVLDKLKYSTGRHFDIGTRANLNTMADIMKQEDLSPFTTRLLRSLYDLTNYTGMYMKLRSFSGTFSELLQKHLFSSKGGKINDNIYSIINKVEQNKFLSDSEMEKLYDELKNLYNSKGLNAEDAGKLDDLSTEFVNLQNQRRQYLRDLDEFNRYVKSNQVNEDIERLTAELDELQHVAGKSVLDDMKAMSSPDDEIMQGLNVTSKELERIRYLDEHENVLSLHEKYYKKLSQIANREFKAGQLSKEQIEKMGKKYVPRELSEEAELILKNFNVEFGSDTGKFNPSEHGKKKSFDTSRKFKTMQEGESWFEDFLVQNHINPDEVGKLYKYEVANSYLTRAIGSNELVLSSEINKFIKDEICTPYTGKATSDRIVMSFLDTHKALSNYFESHFETLSKTYNNQDEFIRAVINEAGMDTSFFKTPRNPKKVLQKMTTENSTSASSPANALFSPNYSYFDVTDKQINVFKKYVNKNEPVKAYNMDNATFDMVNKFTKTQMQLLQSDFTRLYDKFLSQWKLWNTVVYPGFHFQNAVSNAFQSFLSVGGAAFNPKKIKKAIDVVRLKDPKQTMTLAGKKYTYKELNSAVEYYKVADNTFMNYEMSANEAAKMAGKGKNIASKALGKVYEVGGIAGSNIETVGRVNLFLALIDEGKSFERAAEDVDKFLFDYSDLTDFEKNTMRRILPFYTFMRKNIPLMLEQMLKKPVLFSEIDKAKLNIEKMNPDYIGDNDRNEYRQDYIQLPVEINGKQWGISDQLPYTQFDKLFSMKKSDSLPVTLPRQLMGQTSPALKIPAELLTGETMYNGFPIKNEDDSPEWSAAKYIMNNLGTYPSMIPRVDNKNSTDEEVAYVISALAGFPVQVIADQSIPPWERAGWKDKE